MSLRLSPLPARSVIQIAGPERFEFLQGILTNDIAKVTPERAIYTALLTPQGKFLFDFFMAATPDGEGFWLDCDRQRAADLAQRLKFYKLRAKASIEHRAEDLAVLAAFGGDVSGLTGGAAPGTAAPVDGAPVDGASVDGIGQGLAFVDPRVAAMGARLILPTAVADGMAGSLGAERADERAYHAHRIAQGVPESAQDFEVEKSFLLEVNGESLNAVDFRKGCYVGQELTARMKHRATVRRQILRVAAEADLPAPGTEIDAGGRDIGTLLSHDGRRGLALLRLDRLESALQGGTPLAAAGVPVRVTVPDYLSIALPEAG